jgi:hypothetical protein
MPLPLDGGRARRTTPNPCTVITQADRSGSEEGDVRLARDSQNFHNAQGEKAAV